jgi:hypothetical protein
MGEDVEKLKQRQAQEARLQRRCGCIVAVRDASRIRIDKAVVASNDQSQELRARCPQYHAQIARRDGRRWMSCLQPAEEIVLSPAALILPLGFSKAHGQSVYSIMNLAHIAPAITENQTAHQRWFRIAR